MSEVGLTNERRGLATEAARAVITEAFEAYPQLMRVRAMADARNIRSHRVLEKIGMVREGLLRQNRLVRGALLDEVWYGVLRPEWMELTGLAR
jgi:ribosomal-protein-alanine N-acetyltransferase